MLVAIGNRVRMAQLLSLVPVRSACALFAVDPGLFAEEWLASSGRTKLSLADEDWEMSNNRETGKGELSIFTRLSRGS